MSQRALSSGAAVGSETWITVDTGRPFPDMRCYRWLRIERMTKPARHRAPTGRKLWSGCSKILPHCSLWHDLEPVWPWTDYPTEWQPRACLWQASHPLMAADIQGQERGQGVRLGEGCHMIGSPSGDLLKKPPQQSGQGHALALMPQGRGEVCECVWVWKSAQTEEMDEAWLPVHVQLSLITSKHKLWFY